jgi:predicted dehydrogenase
MKTALLLGAGGWSREHWIDIVLPDFKNKVQVIGLVDNVDSSLKESGDILEIDPENRFNNLDKAFLKVRADFSINVLPPECHKEALILAAKQGMDILSEKPIADRHDDVLAIYNAVKNSSVKMAVTQNYRFEPPTLTFRDVLRSGELGRIDYIIARYASDYRKPGSWDVGDAHNMDDPLLLEGSIHHVDMIRNFSGANCNKVTGFGWNPAWSSFKGNATGMYLFEMENGIRAAYEGNSLESGQINRWHQEYYRAECEKGSLVVNREKAVRIYRSDDKGRQITEEIPQIQAPPTGHHVIMNDFLQWLDGGDPVETSLDDNIFSSAMIFAALDAGRDGNARNVQDYLP